MKFQGVVRRNPSLTIKTVSGTIGVSKATGNRIVKSLREKKILSCDGSRKTGEWVIDSDTHQPENLMDDAAAKVVALGAGLSEKEADLALHVTPFEYTKHLI